MTTTSPGLDAAPFPSTTAAAPGPASAATPLAFDTLAALLARRVAATPLATAYRWHDAARGGWTGATWREVGERVARFAAALRTASLPRGARVALLLPNGLDAVCTDQAALSLALVPVPMHAIDNPGSIVYILADSEAAVLVLDTDAQWAALAATGALPATLRQVVVCRPGGEDAPAPPAAVPGIERLPLADWLARGDAAALPPAADEGPREDELAALVYTSGTTGRPKGVMLTHRNVVSNVQAVLQRVPAGGEDVFLSFLPLSHTFERTAGYYLPVAAGAVVAFARSTALLAEDFLVVRPTVLVSVPRIYERVYAALQARVAGSPLRQRLFEAAVATGWRRFRRAQGLPPEDGVPAWRDALAWPLLRRLVAQALTSRFGGRLRVAVSGGAALSGTLARCFLGLGVPIVQGYGMTETSPVVAANAPGDNDPATVGRPLQGVELRLGDLSELQVRGPGVMRGYWKREEDTAAAFVDGWLRTGDQAAIEHGRVRILGRVKEIIVTSTGEKIAPVDLEMAITADPLFQQAWAFGDNRPFIACMVVLEPALWRPMAVSLGLDPDAPASLEAPAAREAALQRIRALTAAFPHYAQPRAVALSLEPWTIENTLMTPTLKLKRRNLVARFGPVVETLYRR